MKIVKIRNSDYLYPERMLRRVRAVYNGDIGMPQHVYWHPKDIIKMRRALMKRARQEGLHGTSARYAVHATMLNIGPSVVNGKYFPVGYMLVDDVSINFNKQRRDASEYFEIP